MTVENGAPRPDGVMSTAVDHGEDGKTVVRRNPAGTDPVHQFLHLPLNPKGTGEASVTEGDVTEVIYLERTGEVAPITVTRKPSGRIIVR